MTGKSNIKDMYLWKNEASSTSKYQDIIDYIKYNGLNNKLMEFEDKYSVNMETTINIVKYKSSTEGPYIYELMAVIIYDSEKYDIRTTSPDNNWSKIKHLSFNNPSMAVYRRVTQQ